MSYYNTGHLKWLSPYAVAFAKLKENPFLQQAPIGGINI